MVLLLIIGVVCSACAYYEYKKLQKFTKKGAYSQGIIVGFKDVWGSDEWVKLPKVRFPVGLTDSVIAVGPESSRYFELGQQVTVIYDPVDPKQIIIDSDGKHRTWITLLVSGLVCFGLIIFLWANDF